MCWVGISCAYARKMLCMCMHVAAKKCEAYAVRPSPNGRNGRVFRGCYSRPIKPRQLHSRQPARDGHMSRLCSGRARRPGTGVFMRGGAFSVVWWFVCVCGCVGVCTWECVVVCACAGMAEEDSDSSKSSKGGYIKRIEPGLFVLCCVCVSVCVLAASPSFERCEEWKKQARKTLLPWAAMWRRGNPWPPEAKQQMSFAMCM